MIFFNHTDIPDDVLLPVIQIAMADTKCRGSSATHLAFRHRTYRVPAAFFVRYAQHASNNGVMYTGDAPVGRLIRPFEYDRKVRADRLCDVVRMRIVRPRTAHQYKQSPHDIAHRIWRLAIHECVHLHDVQHNRRARRAGRTLDMLHHSYKERHDNRPHEARAITITNEITEPDGARAHNNAVAALGWWYGHEIARIKSAKRKGN